MKRKSVVVALLSVLLLLSAPISCLAALLLTATFVPIPFSSYYELSVTNGTGETLYVTPIGQDYSERRFVLDLRSHGALRLPQLRRADIRLGPGQSVRGMVPGGGLDPDEWLMPWGVVVRDEQGEYRQQTVQLQYPEDVTLTISAFDQLGVADPQAMAIAQGSAHYNVRIWAALLGGLGLVVLPFGLLWGRRRLRARA